MRTIFLSIFITVATFQTSNADMLDRVSGHWGFVSDDEFYWIEGPGVREGDREGVVGNSRMRCDAKIS